MEALLITRIGEGEWLRESLFDTYLPPLRNSVTAKAFVF